MFDSKFNSYSYPQEKDSTSRQVVHNIYTGRCTNARPQTRWPCRISLADRLSYRQIYDLNVIRLRLKQLNFYKYYKCRPGSNSFSHRVIWRKGVRAVWLDADSNALGHF